MRSKIVINLNNLAYNYKLIKDTTKKEIIAVLKDNAYGHDLIRVAKTLTNLGVKMIAVATLEEALYLRKNLIFTPILLFERVKNYRVLSSYQITISIHSLEHLKEVLASKICLNIHLEIETGFSRFGLTLGELDEALTLIKHSSLKLKGIYTHFQDEETYEDQLNIFKNAINKLENKNILIHCSSSKYILKKESISNTIRIGMCLYGVHSKLELKPVMSIYSYVLRCQSIKKDAYVSYGKYEKTESDGYIITIGIGYGDGWKKEYQTIGYINDRYFHQIGVTNMDALMLFSKVPIKPLELVELLGEHLTLNDLTTTYQIDSYDFLASLNIKIPREFI